MASGRRLKSTSSTRLPQIGGYLLVDLELAGVDDAHVEAGFDGVIEKREFMASLTRGLPRKRKRQVADAAAHLGAGAAFLELSCGLNEGLGVLVVLFDARGHGEYVRIKNDVLGWESDLFGEDAIGTFGNLRLCARPSWLGRPRQKPSRPRRRRNALMVRACFHELLLALLETDGVDDALALKAFEPRFDDGEVGAVEHDGKPGDVGLGGNEIQETSSWPWRSREGPRPC